MQCNMAEQNVKQTAYVHETPNDHRYMKMIRLESSSIGKQ
jgi:hypothetical protein